MKKASITEAKNNLSALIDGLKSGSPVMIVDRGRPVARLEPIAAAPSADERLAALQRDGLVRRGCSAPPMALFSRPPPRAKPGASALEALLGERREGR
jgi:prevent-host-death family protein